jgi:predicted O-methyltransferase YrrM
MLVEDGTLWQEMPCEVLSACGAIRGYTKPESLRAIYAAVMDSPAKGGHLEIGCYLGRSTVAIGMALRRRGLGEVVDVVDQFAAPESDPKLCADYGAHAAPEATFRANMERNGIDYRLWRGSAASVRAAGSVQGPLRFAFIDGDHSYEGAKHDIEWVLPLMASGGYVAMDDCLNGTSVYGGKCGHWGVLRAAEEVLRPRMRRWTVVHPGPLLIAEVM